MPSSASSAGVNVKLAKCGGHRAGQARCSERARELGFRTFLGCMEETSVGIAASAVVASLAEWVDLDGNLLLADDPFDGLELGPDKRWHLADRPGLGLTRRVCLSRPTIPWHGCSTRTPVRVDKLVDELVDKPPSGRRPTGLGCPSTGRPTPQGTRSGHTEAR